MSYNALALIHSLAAYVWLGSLFGTLVFTTLGARRSPEELVRGAHAIVLFSTRVGLPAAIILLIAGFWMMGDRGGNYGSTWITIGFVTWLVAAVVGSALMHPAAKRMRKAAPGAPEAQEMARRIALVGGMQIVVLVIAIWVMTTQPGS
jgi:uncharacterized membrane protein